MLLNFFKLSSLLSLPSSIGLIFSRYVLLKLKYLIAGCVVLLQLPISIVHAESHTQEIAFPENEQLKFSQLSTINGLSNSNVFGITQDHQGFIWFATEDGLNRFDGKNFVTYRHNANNKY